MLLSLFVTAAFAGKLAAGLFGIPWTAAPIVTPMEHCTEESNGWVCATTVADVPVDVFCMAEYGALYAVSVQVNGIAQCETVRRAYDAAWGDATPSSPYRTAWTEDATWRDDGVSAAWTFNRYTGKCSIMALHMNNYEQVQKAKKDAARSTAEGL